MKNTKFFKLTAFVIMTMVAFTFSACSDDDDKPKEALITEFAITNAGATGDMRFEGVITDFNIVVVVPFETDLTALIPEISLSPGASVVPASGSEVNFTEPRSFVVTNGDLSNTYQVTVVLEDPTNAAISDITLISYASGNPYEVTINQAERVIHVSYNSLESDMVIIDDITLMPAGTTYQTSSGNDTLDLSQEDISITASFAGTDNVYTFSVNVTEAGFDPEKVTTLINRSSATGDVPSFINSNETRGADFDGRYLVMASRQGGNNLYYWDMENLEAGHSTMHLNEDIVSGGTWLISDVRIVNGDIYVSNMVWEEGQVFKVYKWEGVEDENPELVLEYVIGESGPRLGDAISVIGSPPADGYIFASNFPILPNGVNTQASEFYMWNFNNGASDAQALPIDPLSGMRMGQYGRVTAIPGEPGLLLVTGAEMGIGIMDFDGDFKAEVAEPAIQTRSFDPSIFEYNGGLYITYTVNREWEPQGAWYEIINVTEGANLVEALQGISDVNIDEKRVYKRVFSGPANLWVGATNGVGFSPDGKPRVMAFCLTHGFIVQELSH